MSRSGEGAGATILLVEDCLPLAAALTALLTDVGYRVVHLPRARPALAHLLHHPPALLLLDLGLPDLDGLAACRLARRLAPALPIVILTARTATGEAVAGLDAGADDYIRKPVERAVLLARVGAVLRARAAVGAVGQGG